MKDGKTGRRWWGRLAVLALMLAALPVVGGWLGALHPMGDSLAVFRAQGAGLVAVLAVVCLIAGARLAALAGLALAGFAGGPVLAAYLMAGPAGGELRVYQKNVSFRNAELALLEADIRAANPDVLTLQEVTDSHRALLVALSDALPHQLWCPFAAVGGVAVATHLPPVPGQEICAKGLAALQVTGPEGPVWLISVHLYWPWPHGQAAQVRDLLAVLDGMEAPVVMAGDFNMVRWSDAMAALRWAGGTAHAGPVRGTYTGFDPWLRLPIDHVLAPGGGQMTPRPALGSDHLGLLADVGLATP